MTKSKQIEGIDVSHWQGKIDFNKVKKAGKEFVILKAGGSDGSYYMDNKYLQNYTAATAAGLHVGAYYFAGRYSYGRAKGVADARHFITLLGSLTFDYPVFIDIEATSRQKKAQATEYAIAFCETMEKAGWWCGIYASDVDGFKYKLDYSKLAKFSHWVADYSGSVTVCKDFQMRQYSSKGKVAGISGSVDLDFSLVDYAATIKKKGLNNFKAAKKEK